MLSLHKQIVKIVYYFSLRALTCNAADEIEKMPLVNTPEVLGLHSNAEIGYHTLAVNEMWAHLIDIQPQTGMI